MELIYSAAIYTFGFVGLASIGLIPLRSWQLLRKVLRQPRSVVRNLAGVFIFLACSLALALEAMLLVRIFHCLVGDYCGPTRAHGWLFFAVIGAAYLALEFLAAVAFLVAHSSSRVAT